MPAQHTPSRRPRERLAAPGATSDAADAHTLADMVRTDSHQFRPVSGDTADAEAVKVVTRAHRTAKHYSSESLNRVGTACTATAPTHSRCTQ
ncbi:transposase [Kitasatospora sp. NPDC008050]|uniref:IS110 family transposase n=1 Tax=Kitasatospora sp. NPDC008050 TaxID=3364021 RepID=UPI0036E74B7D